MGNKLSTKLWEKNGVFDFYLCAQKFLADNFFGLIFLIFGIFFNGSASNFAFYEFFCLY